MERLRALIHASLRLLFDGRFVSLRVLNILRRVLPFKNPMFSERARTISSATAEPVAGLGVEGVPLGGWTVSASTLELIRRFVAERRPEFAFEFGSGVSTVALAKLMRELHGNSLRVIAVEQDVGFQERTQSMLAATDVSSVAKVIHRPLVEEEHFGEVVLGYDLPSAFLQSQLDGHPPDLILIDGPMGAEGIRLGTLPAIAGFAADGAIFLLDDALRDGELDIALKWSRLPGITIRGVLLTEKGLLVGQIGGPKGQP